MKLKWFNLLFIFLSIQAGSYSQNIFDLSNSVKYADYLYKSHEYELASREFERILFMDSTNENVALQLVRSYRLSENYNSAISRIIVRYPDVYKMPQKWNLEYLNILIKKNLYYESLEFLAENINVHVNDALFYKSVAYCLSDEWDEAHKLLSSTVIEEKKLNELKSIVIQRDKTEIKSVPLALGLSAIIPGLGKVYSGNWKDGIFSFVIVGISVFQTYRGFSKNGINSKYGWIYLTLGSGFYIGNIYGSGKAVNKRNKEFNHKYSHEVKNLFNTSY